ncbi:hypothetical protein D3C81_1506240 [compost metagenome]
MVSGNAPGPCLPGSGSLDSACCISVPNLSGVQTTDASSRCLSRCCTDRGIGHGILNGPVWCIQPGDSPRCRSTGGDTARRRSLSNASFINGGNASGISFALNAQIHRPDSRECSLIQANCPAGSFIAQHASADTRFRDCSSAVVDTSDNTGIGPCFNLGIGKVHIGNLSIVLGDKTAIFTLCCSQPQPVNGMSLSVQYSAEAVNGGPRAAAKIQICCDQQLVQLHAFSGCSIVQAVIR